MTTGESPMPGDGVKITLPWGFGTPFPDQYQPRVVKCFQAWHGEP